jgi:hypothetical protein
MSAQPITANTAVFLDPLEDLLRFKNIWFETAETDSSELDIRWVALAIEPEQLETALEALAGFNVPIEPEIHQEAAISHLYADGRCETIPIVQIEFVLRTQFLPGLLERLSGAGLIGRSKDRMVVIRGISNALRADCQIFPAGRNAAYSHFVRWRKRPEAGALPLATATDVCFRPADRGEEFSSVLPIC